MDNTITSDKEAFDAFYAETVTSGDPTKIINDGNTLKNRLDDDFSWFDNETDMPQDLPDKALSNFRSAKANFMNTITAWESFIKDIENGDSSSAQSDVQMAHDDMLNGQAFLEKANKDPDHN